ncbi:sulfite exporter TauE/SafE family protein [Rhodococcus sp. NPDC078407]|uniref:TSUP family transporter n=1 Tax=unclassified Rhodococcus (in: high G+C Gram-positive bacteria) TaxID=192944 RepID=UPI001371699D|nr:sulfite exporter TauE/SafE family protein [Rhodococcus sp. (in: high G+C Gram-positive bacteria)]MYV31237.1 TSUP family transporter [Rhodococcus erythropolis]
MIATLAIAVAAGILIGLSLGALGGGGSILTVPALVYLLAVEPQSATSASLIIVGITSIIAAISHARARHVRWRAAAVFGILGSVTAFGGSILNRSVDPQILLLAFAALMIVAAGAMLRRTRRGHDTDLPNPAETAGTRPSAVAVATKPAKVKITTSQVVKLVASALVVGFLTGFLGVGGGFLIVPALVLALGYSMPVAVGTSLVIISITSAGAFTERLGTGATIPWEIVVPFTLAAIAGSFAGKVISDRVSATTLTRSFAALLLVVAVYVTVQASMAL